MSKKLNNICCLLLCGFFAVVTYNENEKKKKDIEQAQVQILLSVYLSHLNYFQTAMVIT